MDKIVFILLCALFSSSIAVGQDFGKPCPWENRSTVSSNKPSIYITFEKEGYIDTLRNIDDDNDSIINKRYIWVRLHNNTTQGIYVYALDFLVLSWVRLQTHQDYCSRWRITAKEDTAVEVVYYAESKPDAKIPAPNLNWHSFTAGPVWVAPGRSMLIKIPYEHLGSDWNIKIPYHYEFEDGINQNKNIDNQARFEEPRHFAYFRFSWLPESVKKDLAQ